MALQLCCQTTYNTTVVAFAMKHDDGLNYLHVSRSYSVETAAIKPFDWLKAFYTPG